MRVSASLGIAAALVATSVTAQAPDASFKQLLSHGGTRLAAYILAPRCGNASHEDATLVTDLDSGKIVDTSYQQPSINCCGGPDNENIAKTKAPAGIYVEPEVNGDGQYGVFNLRTSEKVVGKERRQFVRVTVVANLYCGFSCARVEGGKNCELYLRAWVKQKPGPTETAGNKQ